MKISKLIADLQAIKESWGDIPVIADTSWSPDNKANIHDYIFYEADELERKFVNPTTAKGDEDVLCIRIK